MPPATTSAASISATDPTLGLPRILCLHGGGTNSRIFQAQCRIIRRRLEHSFRLVFPDAPYLSKPGPDVTSVYSDWGPFRSWMKPQPGGANNPFSTPAHRANDVVMPVHETDAVEVINAINGALANCMRMDNDVGATGEWVGLLGFSQGAKLAASVLLREQNRDELAHSTDRSMLGLDPRPKFRFALLLGGRGPLVSLDSDFQFYFGREEQVQEAILRLPTVHVHGLQDEGIAMHRRLRERCCVRGSTTLVEWDGGHRVPIKTQDVAAVVDALMNVYQ